MDEFETAANEIEASIAQEEKAAEPQDVGQAISKAIVEAVKPFMAKASGGPTSDLKAEDDKRGTLTDAKTDPAQAPKKSGQGYKDSRPYTSEKGSKDHDSNADSMDSMDSNSTESTDAGKPAFFKKKKKKGVKKAESTETDSLSGVEVDEEFFEELGDAVGHIAKSGDRLEEGLAVFGELLSEVADPRKDKVLVSMAKGIHHLITEVKELRKAVTEQKDMVKAVATMPAAPKIAGVKLVKSEDGKGEESGKSKLSKSDRDRLFTARAANKITVEDYRAALEKGDTSILQNVK